MSGKKDSDKHPHTLPAHVLTAVEECEKLFKSRQPKTPEPTKPPAPHYSQEQQEFLDKVRKAENEAKGLEHDPKLGIFTRKNYDDQLARAKLYVNAYITALSPKKYDADDKRALKEKFYAIIDGAAGLETGWNPRKVEGSAKRPHSGVFQTEWGYMAVASNIFYRHDSLQNELKNHPGDLAILNHAGQLGENEQMNKKSKTHAFSLQDVKDLPTTSFLGQGAALVARMVKSFENFVAEGNLPSAFSGMIMYQDHLFGATGAGRYRNQLKKHSDQEGHPGISRSAYSGNYLIVSYPPAPVNDLNPERKVYAEATAEDVQQMLHDKFVLTRNNLAKTLGEDHPRIAEFEDAYLPEWKNHADRKRKDIARVQAQKDAGEAVREEVKALLEEHPEDGKNMCKILKPLTIPDTSKSGGRGHTKDH